MALSAFDEARTMLSKASKYLTQSPWSVLSQKLEQVLPRQKYSVIDGQEVLPRKLNMPSFDTILRQAGSAVQEGLSKAANTPVLPFTPQTTPANLTRITQNVGQQLQKVNLPTVNFPNYSPVPGGNTVNTVLKSSFPVLQVPEQINTYAQSYGRTLAEPQKHPFETAMNILPIAGFAKTKGIQEALRSRLSFAKSPQEAVGMYHEFADKVLKTGGKSDLQALRAALNQELLTFAGTGEGYKKDYALIRTLADDTEVGPIIRTIEDKIFQIDEQLKKVPQYLSPTRGLGKEVARKGYTWDEIVKMKPAEGANILADKELVKISQTPVAKKVNFIDYFRTPENVLKKIGLGNEAKTLRTSYEAYQQQVPNELTKIQGWMKRVPGQEANERIFRALDGENVGLVGEESKVYSEIRSYLNEWANKLKLPQHKRVSDYITRLYKLGTVEQEFDEDLAKIIDPAIAKSVYDPFLQKRIGSRIDYLRNTWGALQAYTKRAVRKVNLDPTLEQLSAKAPDLELSQWNYVKRLTDRVNMRPTEVDNLIDNTIKLIPGIGYKFGQRPTAYLTRSGRQLIYRGTLGLNVTSALRNLTQGVNTYSELGERWTLTGYTRLLKNWGSKELEEVGVLRDSFIQDQNLSVYKKAVQGLDKVLFSLFEGAEKINRGAAYYGAKAKALSQGMDEAKAVEYAKELVRKTQFTFGSIDTPLALSSDLSKTLTQLQTYNIKQLEFLLSKAGKKEFGGLIRWVGSMLVLQKVLQDQLGMKLDLLPINFSLTPSVQIGQAAGQLAFGDEQTKEEAKKNLAKSALTLVPGGVQAARTATAAKAIQEGGSFTPSGQLRFEVKPSVRSLLFGVWSTPEAQDYLDKKLNRNPSSEEKEAEAFKKLDNDTKAEARKVANKMYLQLKNTSSRDERIRLLRTWEQQGLYNDETKGIIEKLSEKPDASKDTDFTKAIRSISSNEGRATFIRQYFAKKSREERIRYLKELDQSGLLTKDLKNKLGK